MSFDVLERLGFRPRSLFTFARSDQMWRYTSAGRPMVVTYGGTDITYTPAVLSRGNIQRSAETGALKVHLKIARTVPVAAALREYRMHPMVVGIHRQQDDPSSVPILQHYGDVAGVTMNGGFVECDVVSRESTFSQPFPRLIFDQTCQVPGGFGSARCGVDEADFSFATTIISIDKSTVIVAAVHADAVADAKYYDAGQIKVTATRERMYVAKRAGTTFTIFGPMPTGVVAGDAVTLIAGDDKSLATCKAKFDNVPNFLGFDQLPVEDPMQKGIVA